MPWHQFLYSPTLGKVFALVFVESMFRQSSGSTMIFTDHHFTARGVSEIAYCYEITMNWLKPQICSMRYTT
jgi:hypothetical protein